MKREFSLGSQIQNLKKALIHKLDIQQALIILIAFIWLSFTANGDTVGIYKFLSLSLDGNWWSPWSNVARLSPDFISESSKPFPYTVGFWVVLAPLRLITFALGIKSPTYDPIGAFGINLALLLCFIHTAKLLTIMLKTSESRFQYNNQLLFSPILIYLIFFQRQFDIIPIYCLVLAFYFANQSKWENAFFFVFFASSLKLFPMVISPFIIIWFIRNKQITASNLIRNWKSIVAFLASFFIFLLLTFGNFGSSTYRKGFAAGEQMRWSSFQFKIGEYQTGILFVAPIVLCVYLAFTLPINLKNMALIWSIALTAFSLFSTPQLPWWSWAVPFLYLVCFSAKSKQEYWLLFSGESILFLYSIYYQYSTLVQLVSWKKFGFPLGEAPIIWAASRYGSTFPELISSLLYSTVWFIFVGFLIKQIVTLFFESWHRSLD
jgi:hypothetical protein